MGRDTYYTYEEMYKQYVNRQKMFDRPALNFEEWSYKYMKHTVPHDELEERHNELVGRHREILSTVSTGRF